MLIVKAIEIEGFRSFKRKTEIEFPESGAILIRGGYKDRGISSGSGKSTILIAVSFALGFCSIPATELKNWDSKVMRVVLTLKETETDTVWKIIRDPKLSVETPGGLITGGADETLKNILRIDIKLAAALTYREQRERGNFINLTDAGKKEFLTVLLRLGEIEKALDDFGVEATALLTKKAQHEGAIAATESSLQINPVTPEQIVAANQILTEAKNRLDSLENPEPKIAALRTEESQIHAEMQKIRQLASSAASANSVNQRIKPQVLAIQAEISKLKENLCPTCMRPWDNCRPQIEQREAQIKTLIDQMQQNLTVISSAGTYATADQPLTKRLSEISQMIGELLAPSGDSQRAFTTANFHANELNNKIALAESMKNRIEADRAALTHTESELMLNQHAIAILGREGFLGSIFDEVLLEIEARTNTMMSQVSNINGFTISFPSTKTTQKGKINKSISTELHKSGKKISTKAISGGQACSIELFSDLATSETIRLRSGSPLGWIALDEAMDGLDVEPKQEALQVIRQNVKGQIFVIDHSTEIKEGFEKVIEIEYDGKESYVVG